MLLKSIFKINARWPQNWLLGAQYSLPPIWGYSYGVILWVSRHFVENVTSSTASFSRNVTWSTRHLVNPSLSRPRTWSTTSPGRSMYRIFVENVTSTTATLSRLLTSSTLQLVDTSLDRLTGDHKICHARIFTRPSSKNREKIVY